MKRAERLEQVAPSASMTIFNKAKEMKVAGIDVANLSAGEPDFDTPSHIKEAARNALLEGQTKYSPVAGNPLLRSLIAHKLRQENCLNYEAENIIVTNGGKQSLFNFILALIEPTDEVIIPSPYWVSYPEIVKLAGGVPVIVPTSARNGYKITAQQLLKAITPKTRLLIINSPTNPTGSVYTQAETQSLASVIVEHDLFVVSDEIYEKLLYDQAKHYSIGAISHEMLQRTAVSGGFSKCFAMTGWRLGYLAAPVKIIQNMVTIQGHSTSGVCTFSQFGGIAAIRGSQDCIQQMLQTFAERRNYVLSHIANIPKLAYIKPEGAFYVFINISKLGLTSLEFCTALLTEQKVAVVPGIAFGTDNYIRLSYAADMESLKKGLNRLEEFVYSC